MEVNHVTERAVSESWAKYRNVVFGSPIVHTTLIVDFVAQPLNHTAGRPCKALSVSLGWCCVLLSSHLIQDRHHPVFKLAVVIVRHNQVADPIQTTFPEGGSIQMEAAEIRRAQTFDKVFFNTTGGSHNARHVFVLHQKMNHLA